MDVPTGISKETCDALMTRLAGNKPKKGKGKGGKAKKKKKWNDKIMSELVYYFNFKFDK